MKLSHTDREGRPRMVNISGKDSTDRVATARAGLRLPRSISQRFVDGDLVTAKGSVVHTAIIAGTQAVKKTAELIPFCHPLPIDGCDFVIELHGDCLQIDCTVSVHHKTGVEMEALTGASVAALAAYDMLKALSHEMEIQTVRLLGKTGGKSDYQASP